MTRRLLTPILVPLLLAACGVAVEQSSLPQTFAPDIIPETETAAAPQPAQPGDADADGVTGADEAVDVASLAPSVTGSIDGLIEIIETEAEAKEKEAEDTVAQPPAQTGVPGSEAVAEEEASVASDETQAVAEVAPEQAKLDQESAAAAVGRRAGGRSENSGMVFESNQGSGAFRSASNGIVSKNEYERGKFQPI